METFLNLKNPHPEPFSRFVASIRRSRINGNDLEIPEIPVRAPNLGRFYS